MFNHNSDASLYAASQQLNPWNNGLVQPLGHAGLHSWQQQAALQQLLAPQLSNAAPLGGLPHMGALPYIAMQHPQQLIAAQIRFQQIAQVLHALAQQLIQLASQGNLYNAQPTPFSQAGHFSASQGQFPVQVGQQFAQPAQQLGLH